MGLPPEERPPGAVNGATFYDDNNGATMDTAPNANGRQPKYANMEVAPLSQDNSERQLDPSSDADPRQRGKGEKKKSSGQQRICGKCQRHLTGQFVRALGDTYHLECFTCYVRSASS